MLANMLAHIAQISWASEDLSLLQDYRSSHRLEAPSAFKNPLGHAILGRGIGKYSPTMARKKNERRISKEQLATAVRKNFNALAVSESEVIVDLLYKVKMQGECLPQSGAPRRVQAQGKPNGSHQIKLSGCDFPRRALDSQPCLKRYTHKSRDRWPLLGRIQHPHHSAYIGVYSPTFLVYMGILAFIGMEDTLG